MLKETLIIIIKDGLAMPSGFVAPSSYTCNLFCRFPADWVENGKLKDVYLEKVFEKFYGQNWRMGNSDGSRYVINDQYSQTFTPDVIKSTEWKGTENSEDNHFWFYLASESGEIQSVTSDEFQADVDSIKS